METLNKYLESKKEELINGLGAKEGESVFNSAKDGLINEFYDDITKYMYSSATNTISKGCYESLTECQKWHFNKHFGANRII